MSDNTLVAIAIIAIFLLSVIDRTVWVILARRTNNTVPPTKPDASEQRTKENPTVPSAPPSHGWPRQTEE
jgi:hypothetical protein